MPIKKLLQTLPERSLGQFIKTTASIKMGDTLNRVSQHFGDNMPPTVSADELKLPDTKIAHEATEYASTLLSNTPTIFRHSLRTYMFGICIGKCLDELALIDREQFYLSCVLSKIGLSDDLRDLASNRKRDFELVGADHAYSFLTHSEMAYEKSKAQQVHEAIALHTSTGTVDLMHPQFSLLYKAYLLDIIGAYKYNVRREVIDAICKQYPRDGFSAELKELYQREPRESKITADMASGLGTLIAFNPLDANEGYPL
eukprot:CAMPEP_0197025644 /NCGR_PEP_ID=MMETSP1384-20130603/5902_1 /TAXON_ID=29189 /ORGANISM="Ammonia sp." /LENGTH=256 /DNA_ID=CAMNT_0042454193 /DNA_START=46 /DNA_END=816 /DNA_ORIENTATION=+